VAAPLLADASGLSVTQATGGRMEPPSADFPLGTDEVGRSILTLTIWGARLSLVIGLTATVVAIVIGTLIGVTSGHIGPGPLGPILPIAAREAVIAVADTIAAAASGSSLPQASAISPSTASFAPVPSLSSPVNRFSMKAKTWRLESR
jgi:ABC-type dipeptide/oligopeptide/nickel transport system permease subunit